MFSDNNEFLLSEQEILLATDKIHSVLEKDKTHLDLSSFDTSNVIDMSSLFNACTSLKSIDVSGFDTSSVTNMNYMFQNCSSLTTVNLNRVKELYDKGNFDDALELLEKLLVQRPDDFVLLYLAKDIYGHFRNYKRVSECYEKALNLMPNDAWTLRNYACDCQNANNSSKYEELEKTIKELSWFIDFNSK